MKKQADSHQTEREIKEGGLGVFEATALSTDLRGGRMPQKLSSLFYSPHQVLQRIGPVAYKLDLHADAKIHPVFHVSQLKKRLGSIIEVQNQSPTNSIEQILEPELILERRMVNRDGPAVSEVLVKWKQLPIEEAS